MIYFTADLHLGHGGIIEMANRPFRNTEEMNRTLIQNFNADVKKNDTVYILGDIAHKMKVEEVNDIIKKMNGKKFLIRGNHDKQYDESLFEEVTDFKVIHYNGIAISLMHYQMMSWYKSHNGSLHLHGHIHSQGMDYNLQNMMDGIRRYDVGVDANDYRPVSIKDVLEFFEIDT